MSTHKHIDRVCIFGLVFALLLSALFVSGSALGIQPAQQIMGYENRLFDTAKVHTIDIVMDDWDSFLASCRNEEYAVCSLVIDGEVYKNVAIRGKGNTSLSTVSSMNSNRYSFKVEFDHYDNTKTYHGLDKLSLNNIIQDTTFMKDYLTYQLMGSMGAAAPLCSYVYITVNGEDWGLYLAAEGVEESFLQRNYGTDYGDLYKPDSLSFGGGRGNGKDFNMDDFMSSWGDSSSDDASAGAQLIRPSGNGAQQNPGNPSGMQRPSGGKNSKSAETTAFPGMDASGFFSGTNGTMPDFSDMFGNADSGTMPNFSDMFGNTDGSTNADISDRFSNMGGMFGGMGMGSSDVLLQYSNDDPASYSNIFSSAKTHVTEADQTRLIQALKALSEGDAENAVNVEQVIRYFVVHNFVVNGDSYTGSMIHNYYLYEEDGKLEMLPWDYNLAFGTFQGGNATSTVNDPIDTPLSVTGTGRPIIDWIFSNEEYTELYHQYFAEFLKQTDFAQLIDTTAALIAPYVEKDPTKFCTYEEFEKGVSVMREFCLLREESIQGQLDGVIPSTSSGQKNQSETLVDASHLTLSDMGSMGMGGGFGGGFGGGGNSSNRGDRWQGNTSSGGDNMQDSTQNRPSSGKNPSNSSGNSGNSPTQSFPSMGDMTQLPEGSMPSTGMFPSMGGMGQMPEGTTPSTGMFPSMGNMGQMPEGTAPSTGMFPSMGNMGQIPEGTAPSTGNFPSMGGSGRPTSGAPSFTATGSIDSGSLVLAGVSVLLLAAAILFVKLYKRR